MKLKLSEVKMSEQALRKLVGQDIPINLAFKLSKLVKTVGEDLQHIEEARIKLVGKYGIEDPETKNVQVKPENLNDFMVEWDTLLEEEVEINFEPLSSSFFEDENVIKSVKMTPIEMSFLSPFFKDE